MSNYFAWRHKDSGLYISKSPADHMILSRAPGMILYFNEENHGYGIREIFVNLTSSRHHYYSDFDMVEIILP